MKKIIGLIIILLGGLLIGGGVFIQVTGNSTFDKKKNETENPSIVRADARGVKTYCDDEMIDTYLQLNDYTKISFAYPKCVKEYTLSYRAKQLLSEDRTLRFNAFIVSEKPKAFLNSKKTYLVSLSEDKRYTDFIYSDIKEMKYGDLTYYYFDATYYSVGILDNSKTLRDEWYIAIPFKDGNNTLTISFVSNDKAISSNAIAKIIKSMKIEENKAEFVHSKEEGNYIVGSIKQNKNDSYEHGYKLKYKVPSEIPEEASIDSDINTVVFSKEDINESQYVSLSIEGTSDSIKERANSYKSNTSPLGENYKNAKSTDVKFKNYNNHNLYYFITSYDLYDKDKNEYLNTYYTLYAFVEIGKNDYVKVYMSNKKIPITEKNLEDYLNFKIEEY